MQTTLLVVILGLGAFGGDAIAGSPASPPAASQPASGPSDPDSGEPASAAADVLPAADATSQPSGTAGATLPEAILLLLYRQAELGGAADAMQGQIQQWLAAAKEDKRRSATCG